MLPIDTFCPIPSKTELLLRFHPINRWNPYHGGEKKFLDQTLAAFDPALAKLPPSELCVQVHVVSHVFYVFLLVPKVNQNINSFMKKKCEKLHNIINYLLWLKNEGISPYASIVV